MSEHNYEESKRVHQRVQVRVDYKECIRLGYACQEPTKSLEVDLRRLTEAQRVYLAKRLNYGPREPCLDIKICPPTLEGLMAAIDAALNQESKLKAREERRQRDADDDIDAAIAASAGQEEPLRVEMHCNGKRYATGRLVATLVGPTLPYAETEHASREAVARLTKVRYEVLTQRGLIEEDISAEVQEAYQDFIRRYSSSNARGVQLQYKG